ncbi:MAG: hypothetical protein ACRD21_20390, partial [Vicinamibacteria bacterium]
MSPLLRRLVELLLLTQPERYREEIAEIVRERVSRARRSSGYVQASLVFVREILGIFLSGVSRRRRSVKPKRGASAGGIMDSLFHDLRIAARGLSRRPAFTLVAVLALALGIGASISIFTVFHAIVLRPLPFADSDRLVALWEKNPERDWHQVQVAPANYLDWRAEARSFSGMAGYDD